MLSIDYIHVMVNFIFMGHKGLVFSFEHICSFCWEGADRSLSATSSIPHTSC